MPLSVGDKLGPYEILAQVGAGGMGVVWKARDSRLNRFVAVKTSAAQFSKRFELEARAIAALNHPHICQIYDVGPDYLVMEYIEGSEIKGPLPLDRALRAAIQLASALEAAHRKSITHRDLKPANILTTKSGVKVLDFGLAKFAPGKATLSDATETQALTQEGTIAGTLPYMAPEQLQGKPADARSDIFAFGCVLYEILTGKRAFRAENQATLIAAIMDREPEPLTLLQPMIPPMLERVVKKCLAKDPDDRWQHASDLKSELEWILESGSNAAMPAPVLEHRRRNARLGWLFAGLLTALLAAFTIFHYRTTPAPAAAIRFEIPPPAGTSWGVFDYPIISPDGSRILFSALNRDGSSKLWIRSMDSVEATPIPGTESIGASIIGVWSPDGRSIAYVAQSKLQRLEIAGGAPQILGAVPVAAVLSWSPDGVILFLARGEPRLQQIPAAGGVAKAAISPSPIVQSFANFLPGGRRFLYASSSPTGALFVGALDSKEATRLTDGYSGAFVPPSWLLNVRGSTLMAQSFDPGKLSLSGEPIAIANQVATHGVPGFSNSSFSVSQNGVLAYRRALPPRFNELTWYDRQGKPLGTVGEQASYTNPALSPDGKRLAVGRLDPAANTRDIWVLDLVRGVSSRFTFDKADELNPVWSPDGSRIAFSSSRSQGIRDIHWKAAGGAAAEEPLLTDTREKSVEDWSPDGKLVLFNVGSQETHAVPVSGDRKSFPVLKAPFSQAPARLSPDGHWIAYVSMESGRREVFVQSFPPAGGKWQISNGGGSEPSWRGDGKEIYFLSGSTLKAVAVKAAGSSFEAGVPKELFNAQIDSINRRNRYVATADGQRFLFVTAPKGTDTAPFIVVQNWQTALKR